MMTKKNLLLVTAIITMLTACSNVDTTDGTLTEGAVNFNATVEHSSLTRGSDNSAPFTGTLTLWYGTVKGDKNANYSYSDNQWTANPPLYWDDLTPTNNNFVFFATSCESTLDSDGKGGIVADDQSANDNYAKADLLAAYCETTKRKQTLAFGFRHMMSQMTIILNNTQDVASAFTADQLRKAQLTAKSMHADYTTTWDESISVSAGTRSDGIKDIRFCPDAANATTSTGLTFRMIVPAGQNINDVEIIIDGKPYTLNIAHNMVAGVNTKQEITVSKTGIKLGSLTVTDWVENNLGNSPLAINISGQNSSTDNTSFSQMQITKVNGNTSTAYTYNKSAGIWSASGTPIYLDDLTSSDNFYATANNCDLNGNQIIDTYTGLNDKLASALSTASHTANGGALNLTFTHLMAQLTIVAKGGSNFPTSISLQGAKITTPEMIKSGKEVYDQQNSTISMNGTGEVSKYTSLNSNYLSTDNQATLTAIIIPQTINAGSKFIVTLADGKDYTATIANNIELQAGKNNAITLTLNPTTAGIGTVSVADWGTGSQAAANAPVDGVNISQASLSGITEDGMLNITTDGANGHYPVVYSDGVANINPSSNAYDPILWDKMTKFISSNVLQSYIYTAIFVPTTTPAENQEKDYLKAVSSTTPWGTSPSFDLKHLMSGLHITITSDGTYTPSQLSNAVISFVSSKYVSAVGSNSLTISDMNKTINMTNKGNANFSAIVAPQTITKIIVTIDGKMYTLIKDITLSEGNQSLLTFNIVRSSINDVTVSVTGWSTTDLGSQDIHIND